MTKTLNIHDNIQTTNNVNNDIFFIQHIQHTPFSNEGLAIPPIHRHPYYEVVFVTSGHGKMQVDFKDHILEKGTVCLFSPSQVHQPIISSKDYHAYLIRFYPSFFDNKNFFENINIFEINSFLLESKEYEKCAKFLDDLYYEFNQQLPLRNFVLGNLLKCFLITLQRIVPVSTTKKTKSNLFSQLNNLIVENNFQINLPTYYAEKLKVSTRTLNNVVKENSSMASREYISSRTLLEAKRLLNYTTLSIKEIANNLGFEDSAYFSKFFKKATNQSPLDFRDGATS